MAPKGRIEWFETHIQKDVSLTNQVARNLYFILQR